MGYYEKWYQGDRYPEHRTKRAVGDLHDSARLKLLIENGLLKKRLYQNNPLRYESHLTDARSDLVHVLESMVV